MKLKFYLRGLGIGIVVTALIMGIATKDKLPLTDAEIKAAAAKLGMVESDSLRLTDLDQDGKDFDSPSDPDTAGGTTTPEPESDPGTAGGTTTPEPESDPGTAGGTITPEPESDPGTAGGTITPEPESDPGTAGGTITPEPESDPGTAGGTITPEPESDPGMAGGTITPEPESDPGMAGGAATPESQNPEMSSGITETVTITIRRGTGSRAVCSLLAEAGLIEDAAAFDQYLIDSGYSKRISAGTFEIPAGASEEEMAKIISRSR